MTQKRRNPAGQGGALQNIEMLGGIDGLEITPSSPFNQAVRHISRRARVSRFYAAVLAEEMGVRR